MGFFSFGKKKEKKNKVPLNPDGTPAIETTKVIEVYVTSVNNITRSTDTIGKIDPYVVVFANGINIGKTKHVDNATSCVLNEVFLVKPKGDPRSVQYKFDLMDKDDIGDDDEVGSGLFNPAQEEQLENQIVHLKYKGNDIGSITVSIKIKDVIVV